MALGFHMDLLYLESIPGLQFLHSLKNSVVGGDSIFSDAYKAAKIIETNHPAAFEILQKQMLTFNYRFEFSHLLLLFQE